MLEVTGERFLPWMDGAEIHYEHLHRYVFAAQFVKGKRVLDLACGEGYGTYMLAKEAEHAVGVEIDQPTIEHARRKYIRDNVEFIQGSILEVPIEGKQKFDVVVCFEGFEHIDRHDKLLSEIKRLIKDDGLFIVSTPNRKTYTDEPGYHNPFHMKELYFDQFKELVESYFKNTCFLGQKVYSGSNLWDMSSKGASSNKEFIVEKSEQEFNFAGSDKKVPRYFIALASDSSLKPQLVNISNWLVDVSDSLTQDFVKQIGELSSSIQARDTRINNLEATLQEKESEILNLGKSLQARDDEISDLQNRIQSISQALNLSLVYRAFMKYEKLTGKLLPPGTRRRRNYDLGIMGLHAIAYEGWGSFWSKYRRFQASKKLAHSKIKPVTLETPSMKPVEKVDVINKKVTVIIPTRNAPPDFDFTLEKIQNQKGFREIATIVVDSGSTNGTIILAEKHGVKVYRITPEEFNHGLTRNYGASQADGEYILFMVQDAVPIGDYWLYNMAKVLEKDSLIAAVTCRQVPRSDADLFACFMLRRHYSVLNFNNDRVSAPDPRFNELSPLEKRGLAGLDNVSCLIKKDVFDCFKFGNTQFAEDLDFAMRLLEHGHKVAFLHSTGVVHSHTRDASYLLKRSYVENKILPKVLLYEPTNFFEEESGIDDVLSPLLRFYTALNTSIYSLQSSTEYIQDTFSEFRLILRNNLKNDLGGSQEYPRPDIHLGNLFNEIQYITGPIRVTSNDIFITEQYLNLLDGFQQFMYSYNPLIENTNELFDSFYKLFAIAAGSAFANFYLFKSRNGMISDQLSALDRILSKEV
jgi:2-polyprenyl-3-methyl-5-hydroxy-6-metoxy-1,4-benzoquinol methylase/glycosyltransferase involved in cell wall biosynthesis